MNRRRLLVVAAVIILLAMIGWRRVSMLVFTPSSPQGVSSSPSAMGEVGPALVPRGAGQRGGRDGIAGSLVAPADAGDFSPGKSGLAHQPTADDLANHGRTVPELSIYVIRSSEILRETQPQVDAEELLLESVRATAASMENHCIILDRDGLATTNSPFVIYSKPKFDLTAKVKEAFMRLREEASPLAESDGSGSTH